MNHVVTLRVASDNPHPALKDCRDCKWCSTPYADRYDDVCSNPRMGRPRTGHYWAAHALRADNGLCSVGALWFEPQPRKQNVFQRIRRWFA